MSWRIRTAIVAALCAVSEFGIVLRAAQASNTWDGGSSTTSDWNDPLNWDDNLVPSFPGQLTFAGTARTNPNNNNIASATVQSITFSSGADPFTITGNAITLGTAGLPSPVATVGGNAFTNGITNSSASNQTVNLALTLLQRNRHNFVTDSGAGSLTLGGAITRQTGATAHFMPTGGLINTTLTNDATGIIGAWATTGTIAGTNPNLLAANSGWAANDGTGKIVPYTFLPANTFAGGSTVSGVTSSSNVEFTGGGTLTVPAATSMNTFFIAEDATARTITLQGALTLSSGGGIFRAAETAGAAQHLITGGSITAGTSGAAELFVRTRTLPLVLSGAANGLNGPPESLNIASLITNNTGGGAVTLVKSGFGVLRLDTSANTFTGGIYLNEGQLRPSQPLSMGTGPVYVAADAQMLQGGAVTQANPFFIAGFGPVEAGGTATQFRGGALRFNSAGGILSGTITLLADARIGARGGQANAAGTGGTVSGKITGNFNLELNRETNQGTAGISASTPSITLTNSTNDWGGNTTIGRGRVRVGGTGEVIPDGAGKGNVIIFGEQSSESILSLDSHTETINGLSAAGDVSLANITNNTAGTGTLRVGNNNATSTYDGKIVDAEGKVALEKIGSGTLTLTSGSNSYTGSTTVSGGTLALGVSSSLSGTSTITTTGSGSIFDVSAVGGFAIGSTQTLMANSSGLVNGSVALNGIAAGNGGTIGAGSDVLTANGGSSLRPGSSIADGNVGTLNIRNLTSMGSDYRVDASGAGDKIVVNGTADYNGGGTITVANGAVAGTYTILTAGTLTAAHPTLPVTTFGRETFALDFSTLNTIKLTVTGGPANMRWTGAGGDSTNWDNSQSNANWTTTDPVTDNTHFYDGDFTTFNDTNGGHYTVNISGTVTPGSITVTNGSSSTYTFNNGSIAGSGNLLFNSSDGTGTLTLNTSNPSWTGAVTLTAGRLNIGNSAAIPSGTFTINGGTIDNTSGSAISSPNANPPMVWGGSFTFAGAGDGSHDLNLGTGSVTLNSNPTVTVSAGTLTVKGAIANGTGNSLTKAGNGTLVLDAVSSYNGGTTINAGKVQITNTGAFSALGTGNISISGTGQLDLSLLTTANIGGGFGTRVITISGSGFNGDGVIYSASSVQEQNAFSKITLSTDATIGGVGTVNAANQGRIDVRANTPTVTLNGHTLTKVGTNIFDFVATTVTPGYIVVATPASTNPGDPRNILAIETTSAIASALDAGNGNQPYTITFNNYTNLQLFNMTTSNVTRQMVMNGDVMLSNNSTTAAGSTLAAPIQINSGGSLTMNTSQNGLVNTNIVLTGNITGLGKIVKQNPTAILTLSGNNSYSGGTDINNGGVTAGSSTTPLGAGNIAIASGATLDLNGKTVAAGALNDSIANGAGVVTNGVAGASSLSAGNNNANGAFSGTINDGTGPIAFAKAGSGTQTLSNANNYSGGTTVQGIGTLVVAHVNALGTGGLSINNTATTQLQAGLTSPVQLPSLTIAGGTSPTAKLDITDNNMVLHNGSITTTLAQLKSGLNAAGTLWTGAGIKSSTAAADAAANSNSTVFAVGAILNIDKNSNLIYGSWPTSPSPDSGIGGLTTTDVLVKYTYFGDADLNGVVDNTTDYDLWSNGFTDPGLAATNGWLYGDFDFSGIVDNTTDYDLWSTGFAHQGGPLSGGGAAAPANVQPVPEPASLVLAALGLAGVGITVARRHHSWRMKKAEDSILGFLRCG